MNSVSEKINREKTAIFRVRLSSPMQLLLKHQFLDGKHTILDYGCGRGDDLRALEAEGIKANGWDPHYAPKNTKPESDIVNLGFVINVIENPQERLSALQEAYKLAKKLLVVSVMLRSQANYQSVQQHLDGVRTTANTFQKYFTQEEFKQYVEKALGRQPVVVGPGSLFVFRRDEDEQDFLEERHSHHIAPQELLKWSLPADKNLRDYERNKELLEHFWRRCLEIGRPPASDEYSKIEELTEKIGSPKRALTILNGEDRQAALQRAAERRVGDLSVFFSLNLFERRKSANSFSKKIQRDIKAFFGTLKNATEQATPLLFSAGKPKEILSACQKAVTAGYGYLDREDSLTVTTDLVERLPVVLRIYVGCASQIHGDIDSSDLVKIHVYSAKLTLMRYDDFINKPIPLLVERIKIDMRARGVDYFNYGNEYPPHPLYLKSRYMNARTRAFKQQREFDDQFSQLMPVKDFGEYGPSAIELEKMLKVQNLKISGFSVVKSADK